MILARNKSSTNVIYCQCYVSRFHQNLSGKSSLWKKKINCNWPSLMNCGVSWADKVIKNLSTANVLMYSPHFQLFLTCGAFGFPLPSPPWPSISPSFYIYGSFPWPRCFWLLMISPLLAFSLYGINHCPHSLLPVLCILQSNFQRGIQ